MLTYHKTGQPDNPPLTQSPNHPIPRCPVHGFPASGAAPEKAQAQFETKTERRRRRCRAELESYRASTVHPSIEDVLSSKISVKAALDKGLEVQFGGRKIVFLTKILLEHYDNEGRLEIDVNRLSLVKPLIAERNAMMPGRHHGDQIVLMSQKRLAPDGKKIVLVADRDTGVALSVMKASQSYCDKNFKLWRK